MSEINKQVGGVSVSDRPSDRPAVTPRPATQRPTLETAEGMSMQSGVNMEVLRALMTAEVAQSPAPSYVAPAENTAPHINGVALTADEADKMVAMLFRDPGLDVASN
jgi:hypothetical protein